MSSPKDLEKFEIWIGDYHLGQGYSPPTEPELVATGTARDFETACLKYELMSKLQSIIEMEQAGQYIADGDKAWHYDHIDNRNSWTGKYYPSKEEALKSFKK